MTRNLDPNLVAMTCPADLEAGLVDNLFVMSSSKPIADMHMRWHAFDTDGNRTYEVGTVHQDAKGTPYATYRGSRARYYHEYNPKDEGCAWGKLGTPPPC